MFVVWWEEALRDGSEQGAKVLASLESAKIFMENLVNGFGGANISCRLFQLGNEIPITKQEVEEKQEMVIKRIKFSL